MRMIQAKLADMYTRVEAARLLNLRAAMACVGLERGGKGTEVHKLAASALLFAAEAAETAYEEANAATKLQAIQRGKEARRDIKNKKQGAAEAHLRLWINTT